MPNLERPDLERPDLERPDPAPTAGRGGGFYLAVGAAVVAALIGAYVLVGTPGLHQPVAKGPPAIAQEPAPAPATR
ncbi:MAG: hypothetical protein JSS04_00480 [Proteobacteria bacterium]|nr:hypothetical protein [Pseudomonadota bacterium]